MQSPLRKPSSLLDRLRTKRQGYQDESHRFSRSFKTLPFTDKQLGWLEDYPDCWVDVGTLPPGEEFHPELERVFVQVKKLPDFVLAHEGDNIWRSWHIWGDSDRKESVGEVPFWLDIDDENGNLLNAQMLARVFVELLIENPAWAGSPERIRISFSGKKGFHIYVKPAAPVDGWQVKNELSQLAHTKLGLEEPTSVVMNSFWGSTVIDVFHEDIRVVGSLHSWRNEKGVLEARRTFELSCQELFDLSVDQILERSQKGLDHDQE